VCASQVQNASEEEAHVPLQVLYAERSEHDEDCIVGKTSQSKRKAIVVEVDEPKSCKNGSDDEKDSDFGPRGIVDFNPDISEGDDDDLLEDNVDDEMMAISVNRRK
jgi:hypothetical protein